MLVILWSVHQEMANPRVHHVCKIACMDYLYLAYNIKTAMDDAESMNDLFANIFTPLDQDLFRRQILDNRW